MSSSPQPIVTTHSTDAPPFKLPDSSALPSPPTSPIFLSGNALTTTRVRLKAPEAPKAVKPVPNASPIESWSEGTTWCASPSSKSLEAAVAGGESEHGTVTPASAGVKTKRRQSSIAYFTPSSPSPWDRIEGQKHRRSLTRVGPSSLSSPSSRSDMLKEDGPLISSSANGIGRAGGKRESLVIDTVTNSNSESAWVGAKEREPLTLVEKHADLLHFIAQKERKCLELREQLTMHEKELVDLKRRWERIVNRSLGGGGSGSYDNPVATSGTNAALGGLALDGFKEGVRKIAAGLTDLGASGNIAPHSGHRPTKQHTTHSQRESDSSMSASADTSSGLSNGHFSTSSVSSFCEGEGGDDGVRDVNDVRSSSMDAAPPVLRSTSLHRRTARSRSREGSTDSADLQLKLVQQHGTTPKTVSDTHSAAFQSTFSSSPPPSAFKRTISPPNFPSPSSLSSPSPLPSTSTRDVKQSRRTSLAAAFPPASSVPGLGSLAMGASVGSPVTSWMGNVGKKLGGIQGTETLSKSQKRASVLFADVSHSIMSALSSPSPSATLSGSISPSSSSSTSSLRTPPSVTAHTISLRTNNLLDDDDGDDTIRIGRVMIPDTVKLAVPVSGPEPEALADDASCGAGTEKAVSSFDDDDSWNW
ncbi:hypothetical protein J3A83DRAFT_2540859 [Scleroderma citrinum]